jgi:hypothetical protein
MARDCGGQESPGAEDWEAIHEEVEHLPERYRTPVVLCYLQGQTYEEAARRIGCPVGTVRVRLSRARERLRGRLTRRGFGAERVLAIGGFLPDPGAILPAAAASTAGSLLGGAAWVEATVNAARAVSLGRAAMAGMVSASVLYSYEGVLRIMMMNWWRTVAVWLLAAGTTVGGAVVIAEGGPLAQDSGASSKSQPGGTTPPHPQSPEPPPGLDSPEALRQLHERRVAAAARRLEAQRAFYDEGRITIDRYIDASEQLMLAKMGASTTKQQRVEAARGHRDRMTEVVSREQKELEQGKGTVADVAEAMVAAENAMLMYLEVRQERGSQEVEALKQRIETLEKVVA